MTLSVRIDLDNDEFSGTGCNAVRRVFEQVVHGLALGRDSGMLRDSNGNTVGSYERSGS